MVLKYVVSSSLFEPASIGFLIGSRMRLNM